MLTQSLTLGIEFDPKITKKFTKPIHHDDSDDESVKEVKNHTKKKLKI